MNSPRIAVCSWSLRPSGTDALIEHLDTLGIHAVQLALGPLAAGEGSWEDASERLRGAGIRIASGMLAFPGEDYATLETIARTGGVRPDETWSANRDLARRVADVAAADGIRLVTYHAGFIPEDDDDPERATILGRMAEIADLFAERGLDLALETGQETADSLVEALEAIDRPNLGVNFDPANMILYGTGAPEPSFARLAPWVRQMHVKDARPPATPGTWGTETPAGGGAVDWDAIVATALAIEPPIDLVIEREGGEDRLADVARARDLVQEKTGWA